MSWMTQTEAAAALRCSNRTIRRRIRAGTLKTRRDGRNILVDVDTDHAMATVTQVGRQLAEVGAAAAIQKQHDTDTITAIQATFADALASLSTSREILDRQTFHIRHSARIAWTIVLALIVLLFAGGWYFSNQRVFHRDELHKLETTLVAARTQAATQLMAVEMRQTEELAATQGRLESTKQAMDDTIAQERQRVEALANQNAALNRTVADQAARLEHAGAARDELSRARDQLEANLRYAVAAADFVDTAKDIWIVARSALTRAPDPEQLRSLREEIGVLRARYLSNVEARDAQHQADLAATRARFEGEAETLQAALAHERRHVQRVESRLDTVADKLVAVLMERAQLERERDELRNQVRHAQEDLQAAQAAADLSAGLHAWWSRWRASATLPEAGSRPRQVSKR